MRQQYGGHNPTGTFPSRSDVLTRNEVLEIYEKYYKFTVKTNDSGDFMITGVPLGNQKIGIGYGPIRYGMFLFETSGYDKDEYGCCGAV